MPIVFAATLFLSALLLFMVQPMIGRMILPLLGGSPSAWNTCMVFFQFILLFGYLYAHFLTTRLQPKHQRWIHAGVLLFAIVTLMAAAALQSSHSPIAIVKSLAPQGTAYPMFGVLALLAVAIGIPFFAVSTSAPLLQRWFADSGHRSACDPYFLYAASNAGSLISLLTYPFVIEPVYTLHQQSWVWLGGFVGLALMIILCATIGRPTTNLQTANVVSDITSPSALTLARKWKWIVLAFVPSSWMLGVTTYMTTDIASIPLLWIIPLALYLLSFVVAFARTPAWMRPLLGNVSPVLSLLLVFVIITQDQFDHDRVFLLIILHNLAYFFAALMCHYELAHDRPHHSQLTSFYLCMSLGGVFGGILNALVAPLLFNHAYEYPIAIICGCLLVPKLGPLLNVAREKLAIQRVLDFAIPGLMLAGVACLTVLPDNIDFHRSVIWLADKSSKLAQSCGLDLIVTRQNMFNMILWALPLMLSFFFIDRPIRFGLCVAAILIVFEFRDQQHGSRKLIKTDRSFFGILKVEENDDYRRLIHGTTLHGTQFSESPLIVPDDLMRLGVANSWEAIGMNSTLQSWDLRQDPLTYYHRTGPVGHLFSVSRSLHPNGDVAMVGLGTGSVSCYVSQGQSLTFYEIDPTVKKLVADQKTYFSFVSGARERGAKLDIVMGDARLELEAQPDRKYDLLLVDAFSSDSIPVHLLTTSAVKLYLDHIRDDGYVALHISNKFVKLDYVAASIAKELGLSALVLNDSWNDNSDSKNYQMAPKGKTSSSWVVLARHKESISLFQQPQYTTSYRYVYEEAQERTPPVNAWQTLPYDEKVKPWTDDYADVMMVMMIKEIQAMRRRLHMPTLTEFE